MTHEKKKKLIDRNRSEITITRQADLLDISRSSIYYQPREPGGEKYIMDLGDASSITASISERFSPYELIGLQEIVYRRDLRLLDIAEKHWNKRFATDHKVLHSNEMENFFPSKIATPLDLHNN